MTKNRSKNVKKNTDKFNSIAEIFNTKEIKKLSSFLIVALILFVSIFVSASLRSTTINLRSVDVLVTKQVYTTLTQNTEAQVRSQAEGLGLPEVQKEALIKAEVNKYLTENSDEIKKIVDSQAQTLKSQLQNDEGQTYLLAIDPYFWLDLAENVDENGHPGTELVDGKPWSKKHQAPIGVRIAPQLHIYTSHYFNKVVNFFKPDTSLLKTNFLLPIILASLAVIPAFFITRKKAGNIGGFVASILVGIHPSFLTRTIGGFSDTDPYNVTLPLFIIWFMIEAFTSKNKIKTMVFASLSALTTALFALAWQGWWYTFDFILGALIATIVFKILKEVLSKKNNKKILFESIKDEDTKKSLIIGGIYILITTIFLQIISGNGIKKVISALYSNPISVINLKSVATTSIWPNVLTTVAELNPATLTDTINSIGGKFLLLCSLLGILLVLMKGSKKKINFDVKNISFLIISTIIYIFALANPTKLNLIKFLMIITLPIAVKFIMLLFDKEVEVKSADLKYSILLTLWYIGTIFAASRGIRFIMLLVPAVSIALGLFAGITSEIIARAAKKYLSLPKLVVLPIIFVFIYLIFIAPTYARAITISTQQMPSMNDVWWNGLEKIGQESSEDAIITSWWDFGHWFRAISKRGVNFDGASQSTPQAHWVGKSLLSSSENETLGIIRMLDCSRNEAYDYLVETANMGEVESINLLYKTIVEKDTEKAKSIITENSNLDNSQADELLKFTHCIPPESFFITSQDMIGKAGVWAHFGSWNFEKAEMHQRVKGNTQGESLNILTNDYGLTKEDATRYFKEIQRTGADAWVSPWPRYYSNNMINCKKTGSALSCPINLVIGKSQQGYDVVVQSIISDSEDYSKTSMQIGYYLNGNKVGDGLGSPEQIIVSSNDGVERIIPETSDFSGSLTFLDDGTNVQTILSDTMLIESTFTKLFFLDGSNMNYFEKFYEDTSYVGGKVTIWKIDWDSYLNI